MTRDEFFGIYGKTEVQLEYVKGGCLFFEGKKDELNIYACINLDVPITIKTRIDYRLDMLLPITHATAWTTNESGESDQIKDRIDE